MGDADRPFKRTTDRAAAAASADARPRSETTTLVFAVSVAVALGVACGIWINSLMASAASAGRAAAISRLTSGARAGDAGASRGAAESKVVTDATDTTDVTDTTDTTDATDAAAASSSEPEPEVFVVEGRESEPAAAAKTPVATPVAREAGPRPKAEAAPGVLKREPPAARAQARATPCATYASASSLSVRVGGAAYLVLGGPGEAGPLNVTTPNWADIVVLREGRAAGGNGWTRYVVKSVSTRPGRYTVHFATPCGSQNINVTVK